MSRTSLDVEYNNLMSEMWRNGDSPMLTLPGRPLLAVSEIVASPPVLPL
jgi:hypothetical protein